MGDKLEKNVILAKDLAKISHRKFIISLQFQMNKIFSPMIFWAWIIPGISLKIFLTQFHSVTTKTQAVVTIYYYCIIFSLPFNGNSMCNGLIASKLTENAVILRFNFSLSDCHLSLIFLEGEVTSSYCQGPAWTLIHVKLTIKTLGPA